MLRLAHFDDIYNFKSMSRFRVDLLNKTTILVQTTVAIGYDEYLLSFMNRKSDLVHSRNKDEVNPAWYGHISGLDQIDT